MKQSAKGMFRTLATRSVIAVIPVAMVSAYATNASVPTPPRLAEYAFNQVAEITVSPNTVGIAASTLYGQSKADIDAQLDQLQALGVQNIRVFVPWALIEPQGPTTPGSASWSEIDLVMQAAKERNLGVLAEINSTPPYAAADGNGSPFGSATPDPAKFATFLSKFVGTYGSEVSAYEIWNEPNSIQFSNPIDPAAYDDLLKASYPVIKQLDPTASVVAGAVGHTVSSPFTLDPVDFVKAMLAADPTIGNYFDALSYHPYDYTLPFSAGNLDPAVVGPYGADTAYNQLEELVALFPTKKVWLSEFGVPTYSYTDGNGVVQTITQDQQEKLISDLINTFGTSFGQNAGPIFLYNGRDTNTGSADPEANFGLYTDTGLPKEVVAYLTAYYLAHPQNPTTTPPVVTPPVVTPPVVTPPTDPAAGLNAALQAFAQQFAQTLASAFSQTFAQALGQQIATAISTAIANALASLGQPAVAPKVSTLALRVASVEEPAATGEPAADEVDATAVTADKMTATTDTEVSVSKPAAETAVNAAVTPNTTPVADTTPASETTPAATTPVASKASELATTTPAESTPTASGTDTTAPTNSTTDNSTKPAGSDTGSGATTKSGTSDKKDSDKSTSDKSSSDKKDSDKTSSDKSSSDKKDSDKKDSDKSSSDKTSSDKTSSDKSSDSPKSKGRHWKSKEKGDASASGQASGSDSASASDASKT